MLINNKNIGYSQEKNILGAIVAVDLLKKTVTLMDENSDTHVVSIEDVIELEELGELEGNFIYAGDVVRVSTTGKVYEIVTLEDGEIAMHLLDKKLERVPNGQGIGFERKQLSSFEGVIELLGNIYELKANQPKIDFNLAVFRQVVNGETNYFYAGNNKDEEEIDLIKVIFLGHQVIEEQAYERITVSYEDFQELVADGTLKQVNPIELANYVAGLAYGKKAVVAKAQTEVADCCDVDDIDEVLDDLFEEEETDMDDDICEECGEHVEDCECELW